MSTRSSPARLAAVAAGAMSLALIAACGGSSASTSQTSNTPPTNNPQTQAIVGIDTPSSVAVVTATNAQ